MAEGSTVPVVAVLLERHGRTYAEELGITLARGTPSPLFRWLCAATLLSARINAGLSVRAARELARRGWTTAGRMAGTSWKARVEALHRGGYGRYQERTATMLGDSSAMLRRRYGGDLRRLREAANRDPTRERDLLKQFKGIGEVGTDIFCREAQAVWEELYPFADRRALKVAGRLGLGGDAQALARHVDRAEFPRLVAALVRADLARDVDGVRAAARRA